MVCSKISLFNLKKSVYAILWSFAPVSTWGPFNIYIMDSLMLSFADSTYNYLKNKGQER